MKGEGLEAALVTSPKQDCDLCKGSGWVYVASSSVLPCRCRWKNGGPLPRPAPNRNDFPESVLSAMQALEETLKTPLSLPAVRLVLDRKSVV